MKRVLALILCLLTTVGCFASCTTLGENDKGAEVDVYLTNEVFNFDPACGFTDASTAKILSLIYEGLTVLDSEGNWEEGIMDEYVITQDDDEGFKIQITLNETKWSDSRTVQANDIVFAWKRILDPEYKCEAAPLLYDIKNARDVKMGDASIDDLGVFAIETYVLEIEFEKKVDLDEFFKITASPALVPLREDVVSTNPNWAKKTSSLVTNGPFDITEIKVGESLRLERSAYYYRDTEEDEALDKYVIPYRIVTHYDIGFLSDQLDAFLAGEIHYIGELPLDKRGEYAEWANVDDIPVTHTYYFNQNNELFANADVRRALSMAIDRNEIAALVTYAKPATGFIPGGVCDAEEGSSFREVGGDKVPVAGDIAGAKSLLNKAGVNGGSFAITVRDDEVDYAVATYVKGVWEELGFTVKIRPLLYTNDAMDSTVIVDDFYTAYTNSDFDVIALDMQMLTDNAYAALAPFATGFSGNGVNMNSENYEKYGHVSGYNSEAYNEIFEKIYETTDKTEEATLLHEAENMLIDEAVVMPVFFEQDAFMFSSILDNIGGTYFGRVFDEMTMENYEAYKESVVIEVEE